MTARLRKVPLTMFQRFFRTETLGGLVLLSFGLAALAIANSPLSEAYTHFLGTIADDRDRSSRALVEPARVDQ